MAEHNYQVKKKAEELYKELKKEYPLVFLHNGIETVEDYVAQSFKHNAGISVNFLYDYVISQGLCVVEE